VSFAPLSPADRVQAVLAAVDQLRRATQEHEDRRASAVGLRASALPVLEPLADALSLPAGELGRRSGLSASALSHALARHERAGLVERERQRGDGRVVLVRLTREGRRVLSVARSGRPADALEAEFSPVELDQLAHDLRRLAATLERRPTPRLPPAGA
jgi:DNA-binding MarR family transcriptional regulator